MSSLPGVSIEQYQKGWNPPIQNQESVPGQQHKLKGPEPLLDVTNDGKLYKPAGKLEGKNAIVSGADSGIGRSVALLYALEGADLTMTFLPAEKTDGENAVEDVKKKTKERTGRDVKINVTVQDLKKEDDAKSLIESHAKAFGGSIDILALNQGTQMAQEDFTTLDSQQWLDTFDVNIHSMFFITKHAIPKMPRGGSIIMNGSVNAFVGRPDLIDYTSTKGAMLALMRALSNQIVAERGIRVNLVAPGPIWTPLVPATMTEEGKKHFGDMVPMLRPGQPVEVATCFVFLASADSGYISGQTLHPNGGMVIA